MGGPCAPGGGPPNADVDAKLFAEMASLNPKPAFIVNTGDVCEIGGEDQYTRYREIIEQAAGIPMYVAPGNHDVRWNPRGKEGFVLGAKQPLYQSWGSMNLADLTRIHARVTELPLIGGPRKPNPDQKPAAK